MRCVVYIATSLDGFIADKDGGLDWLQSIDAPEGDDLGFSRFQESVDAVVMGRVTFESVVGFGIGWPYSVPGIILSSSLRTAPAGLDKHVSFTGGSPEEVLAFANELGHSNLYLDGGRTIQDFLRADLVDEMILTEIPVLLGGGARLFDSLPNQLAFELVESETLVGQAVKRHYRRKRDKPPTNQS